MAQVLPNRRTPDQQLLGAIYDTLNDSGIGESVTVADGADSALGAKADSVAINNTGTFSLISLFKRLLNISQQALPFGADYLIQSNPDIKGNYQTIVYKTGGVGGTIIKTVTLTFDVNSNVLTYTES